MAAVLVVVKHIHVWLVVLSISGFAARFALSQAGSAYPQHRWVKTTPHIVDTLLLASGITLAALYRLSPLQAHWLGIKLCLVALYIVCGYLALKSRSSNRVRRFWGFTALGLVVAIVIMAVYKPV